MALEDVEDVGLEERRVVAAVGAVGLEVCGTEFGFGLCLEDGLLDAYTEGAHKAAADDLGRVVFLDEVLDHTGVGLTEGALVGAAFGGVLAVDEGIVVVVVLAGDVGEGGLEVAFLDVDDGVEWVGLQVVLQQVEQAVLGVVALAVVVHGEPAVEVGVVPDAFLNVFAEEVVVAEEFAVGDELDEGAAFGLVVGGDAAVGGELALGELGTAALPVAEALDAEPGGEGVDGFGTYAVQSHRLLEHLAVVFGAGVELADGLDQLAEGDAATVVADADFAVGEVDVDLDFLAEAGGEFVYRVVDYFFDEHVDAVVV